MATSAPPDLAHEPLTDPDRPHATAWLARLGRFSAKPRRGPVALVADEDADLPQSAHDLIDHVDRLSLPAGAEAPSSVTSGSGPGGSRPGSTAGCPS